MSQFIWESESDPGGGVESWRNRGAINLTCFRWRQVALRTSSLWNSLVICDRRRRNKCDEDTIPKLSLIPIILERAGAIPLNVDVFSELPTEKYWNTILPLIARAVPRSRVLEIKVNWLPRHLGIFSEPSPLPKLRYLSLEWAGDTGAECIDLSQAISITFLSINSSRPIGRDLRVRLPEVCTLKTLSLKGSFALTDVTSVVTCCASQLEWLTLDISDASRMVQETQIPASLPLSRLHELQVRGRFSVILMRTMNAPRLQSLTIESVGMVNEDWIRYPHPLSVTQQFPVLVILRVPFVPDDIVTPYLAAHPALETVGVVSIALARALLPDNSRPRILPNLRSLSINCMEWQAGVMLRELVTHLRATGSSSTEPKCMLLLQELPFNEQQEFFQLAQQFKEYIRLDESLIL